MRNLIVLLILLAVFFVNTPMAQLPLPLPTVVYDYFTPHVVRTDRTAPALYSARISGIVTRVTIERGVEQFDMVDDGTSGDVKAQDGIYTYRATQPDRAGLPMPDSS